MPFTVPDRSFKVNYILDKYFAYKNIRLSCSQIFFRALITRHCNPVLMRMAQVGKVAREVLSKITLSR